MRKQKNEQNCNLCKTKYQAIGLRKDIIRSESGVTGAYCVCLHDGYRLLFCASWFPQMLLSRLLLPSYL